MKHKTALATAAALAFVAAPANADDDSIAWRGFFEPELRAVLDGGNPGWANSAKPDARLNLVITPNDDVEAYASAELDVRFGPPQNELLLKPDMRELWVRLSKGRAVMAAGRQILSWGSIGEFGAIDYLNPQQLPDTAQNWAERKQGVWSGRMDWEADNGSLEAYLIPIFTHSELPANSPWVADRFGGAAAEEALRLGLAQERGAFAVSSPTLDFGHTQGAVRGYFSLRRADVGVGAAHLFSQVAALAPDPNDGLRQRYNRWSVLFGETSLPIIEGFGVGVESALLLSHDDWNGDNAFDPNSRVHWAVRLKGFLSTALQFEVGALGNELLYANGAGERKREAAIPSPFGNPYFNLENHLANVGLYYRLGDAMHVLSATYATALDSNGHYLSPVATFRLLDVMLLSAGAQIYAGNNAGLGSLDEHSNLFVSSRVDF